jgi:hypothetical protein
LNSEPDMIAEPVRTRESSTTRRGTASVIAPSVRFCLRYPFFRSEEITSRLLPTLLTTDAMRVSTKRYDESDALMQYLLTIAIYSKTGL